MPLARKMTMSIIAGVNDCCRRFNFSKIGPSAPTDRPLYRFSTTKRSAIEPISAMLNNVFRKMSVVNFRLSEAVSMARICANVFFNTVEDNCAI